jgi:hypothetical protein
VKVIEIDEANIEECVKDAQHKRVVLTRWGKPVALLVGVGGWTWSRSLGAIPMRSGSSSASAAARRP